MRFVLVLLTGGALFAQRQMFDVQMLLSLSRVSEAPHCHRTASRSRSRSRRSTSRKTSSRNKSMSCSVSGGSPTQLTHDGTDNERPRWSPRFGIDLLHFGSQRLLVQVWVMDNAGGHARQITHLSTEAGGLLVSPDGKKIVFQSSVYPECGADDACNKDKRSTPRRKAKSKRASILPCSTGIGPCLKPSAVNIYWWLERGWIACEGSDARSARRSAVLSRRSGRLRDFAGLDRARVRDECRSRTRPPAPTRIFIPFLSPVGEIHKITIGMGADNSPLSSLRRKIARLPVSSPSRI